MILSIICVCLLVTLFFLSQVVSKSISSWMLRKTRNYTLTIQLLSFIFLPGVIVHELAHMFMASFLFVPVGEIEFFPQVRGDVVKLGSVAIGKTDPIRRFLIGVAPLLVGIAVIGILFFTIAPFSRPILSWQTLLLLYALFEVGNTMFSSKKDMEGAIGFFIVMIFAIGALWFFHIPLPFSWEQISTSAFFVSFLTTLDTMLGMIIGINLLIYSLLKIAK